MAVNLLRVATRNAVARGLSTSAVRQSESLTQADKERIHPRIGKRDVVGYGHNGIAIYYDVPDFPCPAIRFKEDTAEVAALRQKEKGDWSSLTLAEKKELYRSSFCQTYAEMRAPTGEWKAITALVLASLAVTGWVMIFYKKFVYSDMPSTFNREWQEATLQRMVVERQGAIEGVAADYDYDSNKWK